MVTLEISAPRPVIIAWCRGCGTWTPEDEVGRECGFNECTTKDWRRPRKRIRRRAYICPYEQRVDLGADGGWYDDNCQQAFFDLRALERHHVDDDFGHGSTPPWMTKEGEMPDLKGGDPQPGD